MATPIIKTITGEKTDEYQKELAKAIQNAEAEAEVSYTHYDSCVLEKQDADQCYRWAKGGYDKYKLISLGNTSEDDDDDDPGSTGHHDDDDCHHKSAASIVHVEKDASESLTLICDLKDSYKMDLDEKLKTALKGLKSLGEKVKAVNEAYCKVESELGDNCNNAQLEVLKSNLPALGDCVDDDTPGDSNFDQWINKVDADVKAVVEAVNVSIDHGVQVASLNATVDLGNLKLEGESMHKKLDSLKSNVEETTDYFKSETQDACDNIKVVEECLSVKWFVLQKQLLCLQGLYKSCHFADDPSCVGDSDPPKYWNDLKEEVKQLIGCADGC